MKRPYLLIRNSKENIGQHIKLVEIIIYKKLEHRNYESNQIN